MAASLPGLAQPGRLLRQLRWLAEQPLSRARPRRAQAAWLWWQFASRCLGRRRLRWAAGLSLYARPGLHGVTANVGVGLADPEGMAFLFHFLRPGELFVDVGANAGSYSLLALARGARVLAVEPNPAAAAAFRRSLALNGFAAEIAALAVAERPGPVAMDLTRGTRSAIVAAGGSTVQATTLDLLLAGRAPALVKIDVEGAEAKVLAGAPRTLAATPALLLESWGEPALHATLAAAGFAAVTYDPFARRLAPWQRGPGPVQNVLFLRDPAATESRLATAPLLHVSGRRL